MKILFIAPYLGLKELALSVLDEYKEIDIDVYQGNYQSGPKIVRELDVHNNYDVIITRGGTAERCREVTNVPVVEVNINAFDIIKILRLCDGYNGKKVILAYKNLIDTFKKLSDLMGYDIESQYYDDPKDIIDIIKKLKSKDYELIIGDNSVYNATQSLGLNGILLTSGIEGIRNAINESIRLIEFINKDKEKRINASKHKVSKITQKKYTNDNAIRIFEEDDILLENIHVVFPETVLNQIRECSSTNLSIMILGQDGMCKSDAAYLSCFYGINKRKKALFLSCDMINDDYEYDELYSIVMNDINKGGTLVLEDIDKLSIQSQKNLLLILRKITKNNNIKIIATSEYGIEISIKKKILLRSLISILDEVRIELLPFYNYKNEISNMISMYLAKLDVRCASSVVGVKEKGVKMLSDYEWPGNLRQFMRVINELMIKCKKAYISENQVKEALAKERETYIKSDLASIDLSGSLKDIERRVIDEIMIRENMNQAKVEKRLQISHSTLWRKLK